MSSETGITLSQVVKFVLEQATADQLHLLSEQIRQRHIILREQAAARITVGATVILEGLSPKYINGLRGTVTEIATERGSQIATVQLTADSTTTLALASTKYQHLLGTDSFTIKVPAGHCKPITD